MSDTLQFKLFYIPFFLISTASLIFNTCTLFNLLSIALLLLRLLTILTVESRSWLFQLTIHYFLLITTNLRWNTVGLMVTWTSKWVYFSILGFTKLTIILISSIEIVYLLVDNLLINILLWKIRPFTDNLLSLHLNPCLLLITFMTNLIVYHLFQIHSLHILSFNQLVISIF